MKYKKIMLCLMLLLGISLLQANAQIAVVASGGDTSGSGGTVSYSIGQVFFSSYTESSGLVHEGVQGAYEITVVSGEINKLSTKSTEMLTTNPEFTEVSPELYAYPNPTTDILMLRIDNYKENEKISYQLINAQGEILESIGIKSSLTSISMVNLAREAYFLKVIYNKRSVKTFKIIKY